MKYPKLPFNISLERKYNDINADEFPTEWNQNLEHLRERTIHMSNDLHIELGKFKTFDISMSEIVDLGMRYALSKQEFRRMTAIVIETKKLN